MYSVLADSGAYVYVSDEDIARSLKDGFPLKREIVMAMGRTHKVAYLPYLYPYLNDERFYMRRDAAQRIFLIDGRAGLNQLKEREQQLDESDFEFEPSEKALLQAMIIQIEKGTAGAEEYFFSAQGNEIVKYVRLAHYSKGYRYQEEDLRLMAVILNAYIEKSMSWIKKLPRSEVKEAIFFALQSVWFAYKTDLMQKVEDDLCDQLCVIFHRIIELRISTDATEMIAEISTGMRKEYAMKIIGMLNGNVRGDAKKAYKKA